MRCLRGDCWRLALCFLNSCVRLLRRCMQELFLDSQELQDQIQARRDLHELQKRMTATEENDDEDGGGDNGSEDRAGEGNEDGRTSEPEPEDTPNESVEDDPAGHDGGNENDESHSPQDAGHTKLFDDYAKLVHKLGMRVEKFIGNIEDFAVWREIINTCRPFHRLSLIF